MGVFGQTDQQILKESWENYASLTASDRGDLRSVLDKFLTALDQGHIRVAEPLKGAWHIHQWVKMGILLTFRLYESTPMGTSGLPAFDKIPLKFEEWTPEDFQEQGLRALPGSVVRRGAYIGSRVVLMPSFVNIGAFVGSGTMVDTWATIGSCAQVGNNCHISGGVGLGGVLEPLQAQPVIIEDNCFIGARSEIVEGVKVGEGAVIGMGVFIGASTPLVNRLTGDITFGEVPPYSVVLAGSLPGKPLNDGSPGPHLNCAVIVKEVDAKTRSKTSLNDLLRP